MKRVLLKVLLAIVAVGIIGYAFIRSVQSTREEPYEIRAAHLQNWTLAIDAPDTPSSPVLVLRPPRELASTLFRQLFTRHAESFNGPTLPYVPLLLQEEFTTAFAGTLSAGALLEMARQAGLETAPVAARCMAYRRDAAPGVTRQLYFVVFDAPVITGFREALAAKAAPQSGYDPAALSAVMFVAASDENFNSWLPVRVGERECVAPIEVK